MIYTEDLIVTLYESAAENGNADKQIRTLANGNNVSEEEIIDILQRNGCDVEDAMGKRKKKKVLSKLQEIKQAPKQLNEKKEKEDMEEKKQETVEAPVIPALVYELVKEKIPFYANLINTYTEKIEDAKKKKEELEEFISKYE